MGATGSTSKTGGPVIENFRVRDNEEYQERIHINEVKMKYRTNNKKRGKR